MDFKKSLHRRRFRQKLADIPPEKPDPEALEARESLLSFARYVAPEIIHRGVAPHNLHWVRVLQTDENSSCLNRIAGNDTVFLSPRGAGKSAWLALFVCWAIGHNPSIQIIYCANSEGVSISKGRTIRRIIESPKYQKVFPRIRPSKTWGDRIWEIDKKLAGVSALESDFTFYAVGATGSIVSRRAHLIVGDDLVKSSGGTSQVARNALRENFYGALLPTLIPEGRVVVGGTRFHGKDIYGTDLHEENGWQVITHQAIVTDDGGRERSFWPGYFHLEDLQKRRAANPRSFQLQFQNHPPDAGESGFSVEWFRRGDIPRKCDRFVVGVDLASSLKTRGDFTCFSLCGMLWRKERYRWVIAQKQGRWKGNNAKIQALMDFIEEWRSYLREDGDVLVCAEATSYQHSFSQDLEEYLRQTYERLPVRARPVYPRGDKLERLENYSGVIESGRVIFNGYWDFTPLFSQILDFGVADRDDRVDAFIHGLNGLSLYPPLEAI